VAGAVEAEAEAVVVAEVAVVEPGAVEELVEAVGVAEAAALAVVEEPEAEVRVGRVAAAQVGEAAGAVAVVATPD